MPRKKKENKSRRKYGVPDMAMVCVKCKGEAHHIDHIDGDHKNNKPENLQPLCTLCHSKKDGNDPKYSELRRLVTYRDRYIIQRNVIDNQAKGFKNIELVIPEGWESAADKLDDMIKAYNKDIKKLIETNNYSIWNWLKEIKGIKHVTAAKLISHINIENSPKISSLWRYCGLDATHIKRKRKITESEAKMYGNPFLKKEILGVLGDSFIKQRTPHYRPIYDKEKAKQLELGLKKGHAHRRAIRKMMKRFIADMWLVWRDMEGLEITLPYPVEHMTGHAHFIPPPHYKFKTQLR